MHINIVLLRIIALLSIFVRTLILYVYVKTNYHFICYDVEPDYGAMDKRWSALYLQIVQTVQNAFQDNHFSSLKMVSVYSVYNMVMAGINGVMSVFSTGVSAGFGELIVKKDKAAFPKGI